MGENQGQTLRNVRPLQTLRSLFEKWIEFDPAWISGSPDKILGYIAWNLDG